MFGEPPHVPIGPMGEAPPTRNGEVGGGRRIEKSCQFLGVFLLLFIRGASIGVWIALLGYDPPMPPAFIAVVVFALAVVFNAVAALAVQAVADGHRWKAAGADLLLGAIGLAFIYGVTQVGWWTAGPELAGGFFGTALGTKKR